MNNLKLSVPKLPGKPVSSILIASAQKKLLSQLCQQSQLHKSQTKGSEASSHVAWPMFAWMAPSRIFKVHFLTRHPFPYHLPRICRCSLLR